MKRLTAAIIPLVIAGGLILPSVRADAAGRCDLVKLKAYKPESKLVLSPNITDPLTVAGPESWIAETGCDASVFKFIRYHGMTVAVFNEAARSIQNDEVEKVCKSFNDLDAAKVKVDAKAEELKKAIDRFGKSSELDVSATEKFELLGKILPREQDKTPNPLETDIAKTQKQPALKGGTLFAELDQAYWMLGDTPLLIKLVEAQPGWQQDGAGLFVPGSMKALKDVLMGGDASKTREAVEPSLGLDLFTTWQDSREALNKFFALFGNSAKLEEAYKTIEKAKGLEDQANQDAAGRREKVNQAGVPGALSGQLDTELLSRVFDNKKAAGELSEYATFEEWKSKKGPEAEAELKKLKVAAGLIDAEGKPIQGAGFQVGSDGREILFTPKGGKSDKIAVGFAADGSVDKAKDYSKDIAAIAEKILQRSPAAAKAAALRTAVDQASKDPVQLAKDAAMRGGVFGPLNIAPEAYSPEELASKRQAAMDDIAGQYSSLRQGARDKYDAEVGKVNQEFAAAEQKCLASAPRQVQGDGQAEMQAAYDACLAPFKKTRDEGVAAARSKLKSEITQIGTEEDVKGKLFQSEARQIAATDYLWSQELSKSVVKAKVAIDGKVASDGYLTAADVTEFWDARWDPAKGGAEYEKRMTGLREKIKKSPINAVEGTVKGTVLKEFQEWWAPKRAARVKLQEGIVRPGAGSGGDNLLSDIDREIMEERGKQK